MNTLRCLGFAAALAICASGADAQLRSNTSKFFLTFGVNGTSLNAEDLDQDEAGPGFHLGAGYGFNRRFALFLDAGSATIDDNQGGNYLLTHVDLGVRLHFGNTSKAFIPYIEAALSGRVAELDDLTIEEDDDIDVDISGGGFTLGGGLLYYFNPKWAFNAHLKWTGGEFSRVRSENITIDGFEIDATTVRLGVGLTWFPRGS